MIIGIDGNEANVDKLVGVSVYTLQLLRAFSKKAAQNVRFTVYLREKPKNSLPQETDYFRYEVVPGALLWSQVFLPLKLHRQKSIDVFFSPAHYSPRFCPVPLVVTIHDLSYFYFPNDFLKKDLYKLTRWSRQSIKKAASIICVSETTKKDVIKFYEPPQEKLKLVYNGFEKPVSEPADSIPYPLTPNHYVLYVGTLQPRKNIPILLQGFKSFQKNNPTFKLAIVGKKGWLYHDIFKMVKDLNFHKDVIFTDYIDDHKLIWLYQNAFCLVHPSLYEGFGIPILEAMSQECPVIASNTQGLREIGADACLYFDPLSDTGLSDKLQILQENVKVRDELVEKGKKRVKNFSWTKCARETLEVIMNVAHAN